MPIANMRHGPNHPPKQSLETTFSKLDFRLYEGVECIESDYYSRFPGARRSSVGGDHE